MQVAALDLGTNTFHLLLARVERGKYVLEERKKAVVQLLSEDTLGDGHISAAAEKRARKALQRFAGSLRNVPREHILSVATSAFRVDPMGQVIADRLQEQTGVPISIISGQEEATLIYESVQNKLPQEGSALILDIGGGSIECIIGNARKAYWKTSLPIGAQRLLHSFITEDPISSLEQLKMQHYLRARFSDLRAALQKHKPSILFGSSGTFTTLNAVYRAHYPSHSPSDPLSVEAFQGIYRPLLRLSRNQRLATPGMVKERADLIVPGCLAIDCVLSEHLFDAIHITSNALKEGLLLRLVTKLTSS